MKTFSTSLFTAALASTVVSGHSFFQELYVNGVTVGHNVAIRQAPNNNPVEDVTSPNMACNVSPTTSTVVVPVKAGDTLTTEWHHGLNGADPNDGDDPIAASHKGPMMGYLAKVDDAATASATGLKWFKFFEDGYDATTKTWAVDKMIAAGGKTEMKLPSCLPDGDYLFRAELLALHSAGGAKGAQFYMECAQITVSGGSGSLPTDTVAIPGLYTATDPGILISIYNDFGEYKIPGPAVMTCGAGGDTPAVTSSAAIPVATSASPVVSSAAPIATSSSAASPTTLATSASPIASATSSSPVVSSTPTSTPVVALPVEEEEEDCEDVIPEPTPSIAARAAVLPREISPIMVRRAPAGHVAYHFRA